MKRNLIRRCPFSSTVQEDVANALASYKRKRTERIVDMLDRILRKELGLKTPPKEK